MNPSIETMIDEFARMRNERDLMEEQRDAALASLAEARSTIASYLTRDRHTKSEHWQFLTKRLAKACKQRDSARAELADAKGPSSGSLRVIKIEEHDALRKCCSLALLFHRGNFSSEFIREEWYKITGIKSVSSIVLCRHIDSVLKLKIKPLVKCFWCGERVDFGDRGDGPGFQEPYHPSRFFCSERCREKSVSPIVRSVCLSFGCFAFTSEEGSDYCTKHAKTEEKPTP